MSPEGWVALLGLAFSAGNIYVTLTVRLEVQKQKTWVLEKLEGYMSKDDATAFLNRTAHRHAPAE